MNPAKKEEIKQKGDTGMVKKTISKTTQKPSVPMAQYILVDIILSSSILTCFSLLWCLAMAQKPCVASGLEVDLWLAVLRTLRPLQHGCFNTIWWLVGRVPQFVDVFSLGAYPPKSGFGQFIFSGIYTVKLLLNIYIYIIYMLTRDWTAS